MHWGRQEMKKWTFDVWRPGLGDRTGLGCCTIANSQLIATEEFIELEGGLAVGELKCKEWKDVYRH